jgi:hypothetical protein
MEKTLKFTQNSERDQVFSDLFDQYPGYVDEAGINSYWLLVTGCWPPSPRLWWLKVAG